MNGSWFPCWRAARIAAAWPGKAAKRSIRKRFFAGPSCVVSISRWAGGGLPAAGARAPSVADLGCGGSRQRAVGAGGANPASHSQQADGLSLGHTRQVLSYGFGLEVSHGGLSRALARTAGRVKPTYNGLVETARQALVTGMDQTGWKVGGRL